MVNTVTFVLDIENLLLMCIESVVVIHKVMSRTKHILFLKINDFLVLLVFYAFLNWKFTIILFLYVRTFFAYIFFSLTLLTNSGASFFFLL